jgi:Fur family peroxide stress response transcriptional regulator
MAAQKNGIEEVRSLFARSGLAVTHQRQVIWQTLMSLKGHPSPEAVYELVREQIPTISLATVYKNLHTFAEHGLVREVSLHHGSSRIETNVEPHHHLVCEVCKQLVDLEEEDFEPIRLRKRAPNGFRVHRYSVEVQGICKNCAD